MKKMEAECPSIFYLTPVTGHGLNLKNWLKQHFNPKNWVSQEYRLHLVCQHPPGPHPVKADGYSLRQADEWWVTVSPWRNHLIKLLQYGVPMGKAIGVVYDAMLMEHMKDSIGLLEEMTKSLPELPTLDPLDRSSTEPIMDKHQRVIGPALRALYNYLDKVDKYHSWGGLERTPTPEGNILWLCDVHREQYIVKPLVL